MRSLGFILRLAIIVALAFWLASQPGLAHIAWRGYVVDTSAAFLAFAFILFAFVLLWFYRVIRFFIEGPRFWRLRRRLNRLHKGVSRLSTGLSAIAAGDAAEAGRLAVESRRLLGQTTATRLLQAQAAQLAGDHRAAKVLYEAMALEPESAVLGYRGLIMAAIRKGDWNEAELQAEKLRRAKPQTPWLNLVHFELAARRQNWREAHESLARAAAARLVPPQRAKRDQAALLLAISEEESRQGLFDRSLQSVEQAMRLAPDWLPAVMALARKQRASGRDRAAQRTIERAWTKTPHQPLATLYRELDRDANPLDAFKTIEKLTRANPEHPASRLALADAALAADLWGEARRNLLALAARTDATQSVYRLLAKLERRESGDERAATMWLAKASEALPDPRWMCSACGAGHTGWQGTCPHCGAFNALEWQTPGVARAASPAHPLIGVLDSGG